MEKLCTNQIKFRHFMDLRFIQLSLTHTVILYCAGTFRGRGLCYMFRETAESMPLKWRPIQNLVKYSKQI